MTPVWEVCAGCGREFQYPHLCRVHMLCGYCHPPLDDPDAERLRDVLQRTPGLKEPR